MRLDEIICLSGWEIAFQDGRSEEKATEKEKMIVRSTRDFFNLDVERFNKALGNFENIWEELGQKDPITKILSRFIALRVGFAEWEEGKSKLSDKEWHQVLKIQEATKIPREIFDEIEKEAYNLLDLISGGMLLILAQKRKRENRINEEYIEPLLKLFFDTLEKSDLYEVWEENYYSFIKHKVELEEMCGELDFKKITLRHNDLKPVFSRIKKEKKLITEEQKKEQKLQEKEQKLQEKNETHDFKVAHGIKYCCYCGGDKSYNSIRCRRENGHLFRLERVKIGMSIELRPICSKCGKNKTFSNYKCKI